MLQQAAGSCLDHAIEVIAVPAAEGRCLRDSSRLQKPGLAVLKRCCQLLPVSLLMKVVGCVPIHHAKLLRSIQLQLKA
jgi:hypothetical protein